MPGTALTPNMVEHWVFAALCFWATKNGDVQVGKIRNEITLRRISNVTIIGIVLVNGEQAA